MEKLVLRKDARNFLTKPTRNAIDFLRMQPVRPWRIRIGLKIKTQPPNNNDSINYHSNVGAFEANIGVLDRAKKSA